MSRECKYRILFLSLVILGAGVIYVYGSGDNPGALLATSSRAGRVQPDNTTITISHGIITAVGAAPTGTAGGDLRGTFPNPLVNNVTISLPYKNLSTGIRSGAAWQAGGIFYQMSTALGHRIR